MFAFSRNFIENTERCNNKKFALYYNEFAKSCKYYAYRVASAQHHPLIYSYNKIPHGNFAVG